MAQFIPTKLTPDVLRKLLSLRSDLAVCAYLLLCELGGHRRGGWLGSVRILTSEFREHSGRKVSSTDMCGAVNRLVEFSLLEIEKASANQRLFMLVGARESRAEDEGARESRAEECTGKPCKVHGKAVQSARESRAPSTNRLKREERSGGARTRAFAIRKGRSAHEGPSPPAEEKKSGELVRLAAQRFGVPVRLVEDLVAEAGEETVAQQLEWWPQRPAESYEKFRSPWGAFVSFCRYSEPAPKTQPRHYHTDEEMRAWYEEFERADRCTLRAFTDENPEFANDARRAKGENENDETT